MLTYPDIGFGINHEFNLINFFRGFWFLGSKGDLISVQN
jgi:hypothetical protein